MLAPGRNEAASEEWPTDRLPSGVSLGANCAITGDTAFKRFRGLRNPALRIGDHCTMDHVQFAVGEQGLITIGAYCFFSHAVLLCECRLDIGNFVLIGWGVTIADSDFHPIAPADRIRDAIACSPLAHGRERPPVLSKGVTIEDDVWIGPNATILKGVKIGAGAVVAAGAVVTHDIAAGITVSGNPASMGGPPMSDH